MELAQRVLRHHRDGTTDVAEGVRRIPVGEYLDRDRFDAEVGLMRRGPLAVAPAAIVAEPGDHWAVDLLDRPLLVVRGQDGLVRSFLNTCRHRGAPVAEAGLGHARRFTCPYHAWVYDDRGRLSAVPRAAAFGPVDTCDRSLRQIPTAERHGLLWVSFDDAGDIEDAVTDLVGGYAAELDGLELDRRSRFSMWDIDGPGWKVAFDGYLEGYHLSTLHRDSIGPSLLPDVVLWDGFGPHQRLVFAQRSILGLADQPERDWDPRPHLTVVHTVFPQVSIAGGWDDRALFSTVVPGADPSTSRTMQTVLLRTAPASRSEVMSARAYAGSMQRTVRDEDYGVGVAIQRGLGAITDDVLLLGRNEIGVQHFHAALDAALAAGRQEAEG